LLARPWVALGESVVVVVFLVLLVALTFSLVARLLLVVGVFFAVLGSQLASQFL